MKLQPAQVGAPHSRRLPYLDGVRAFAVAAVLLYHAGVSWVGGGLLGVDVFFVLSGFLITSLLCTEFASTVTVRLGAFYARRARRLLPALFIMLLGVALYCYCFSSTVDLSSVRGDGLSTLFYFSNWHFVFSHQGYFAQTAAPSPLLHTWSLAVEEQYYLLWPPIALFVLRRWGTWSLAAVAAIGALASAGLMALLFHHGISINRLYYGTDTRAQALLVGSFLGVAGSGRSWQIVPANWAGTRPGRLVGALVGAGGGIGLLWAFHTLGGQDPFLYNGGFLLVALLAGALLTAATSWPTSLLARFLALRPFVLLGRMSYGVYLYHWPIFLALSPVHTSLSGATLLVARLTVTLVVAYLSWRFIEEPIRQRRWLRAWRAGVVSVVGAGGTAAALVLTTITPVAAALPDRQFARGAIPPAERAQLQAVHAFSTHPIRFLLVGDSVATTAAGLMSANHNSGLRFDSVHDYGVEIIDDGKFGCDLNGTTVRLAGTEYGSFDCTTWQKGWPEAVKRYRPQVVGVLLGRSELATHLHDGIWMHVGEPTWDAIMAGDLDRGIRLLSEKGAKVVIFTYPYIDPPTRQLNGNLWPENEPSRVNTWNRLLRQAAARFPGTATVIDLNRVMDPGGHYTSTVDGVTVRWTDGIHVTTAGGQWLQPRVLPEIAQLGEDVRSPPGR